VRSLGGTRAFSSGGGINADARSFVLDRIALGPADDSINRLWYRESRARARPRVELQENRCGT
jgi:hypothetical protein